MAHQQLVEVFPDFQDDMGTHTEATQSPQLDSSTTAETITIDSELNEAEVANFCTIQDTSLITIRNEDAKALLEEYEDETELLNGFRCAFATHGEDCREPVMAGFAGENTFFKEVRSYFTRSFAHSTSKQIMVRDLRNEMTTCLSIGLLELMMKWETNSMNWILWRCAMRTGPTYDPNKVKVLLRESELVQEVWTFLLRGVEDVIKMCVLTNMRRIEA